MRIVLYTKVLPRILLYFYCRRLWKTLTNLTKPKHLNGCVGIISKHVGWVTHQSVIFSGVLAWCIWDPHDSDALLCFSSTLLSFKEINHLLKSLKESQKWCRMNIFSNPHLIPHTEVRQTLQMTSFISSPPVIFFYKCMPLLAADSR